MEKGKKEERNNDTKTVKERRRERIRKKLTTSCSPWWGQGYQGNVTVRSLWGHFYLHDAPRLCYYNTDQMPVWGSTRTHCVSETAGKPAARGGENRRWIISCVCGIDSRRWLVVKMKISDSTLRTWFTLMESEALFWIKAWRLCVYLQCGLCVWTKRRRRG